MTFRARDQDTSNIGFVKGNISCIELKTFRARDPTAEIVLLRYILRVPLRAIYRAITKSNRAIYRAIYRTITGIIFTKSDHRK